MPSEKTAIRSISNAAVKKATGKGWTEWFVRLDKAGAKKMTHKEIVAVLRKTLDKSWWTQMVTVEYEKSRGLRTLGETADAGFEIGAQRTLPLSAAHAWKLLTSPKGLKIWLGELPRLPRKGEAFETAEGVTGELRTINPGKKIRITRQAKGAASRTTIQLTLLPGASGTAVHVHQEKLASAGERELMRKHWKKVLDELSAA